MKNRLSAALVVLIAVGGRAGAQSDSPWDGTYFGINVGAARGTNCDGWVASGAAVTAAIAGAFDRPGCSSGVAMGGIQGGDNVQYQHFFFGIEGGWDLAGGSRKNRSFPYAGPPPATGTYSYTARLFPDDFVMLTPRAGFVGRDWMVYVKAGGVVGLGGGDSKLTYSQPGVPGETIEGHKSYSSGFAGGGGVEWGLNGPWSIALDFLRADLGKRSSTSVSCAPSTCPALEGVTFTNTHSGLTANLIKLNLNYWFDYWLP